MNPDNCTDRTDDSPSDINNLINIPYNMGHFDLKRSKNVYLNFEFSREISNSPEKIFSLFRREILKRDSPFEFSKGDFKGRMSFLPSIGRFRRENLPSTFSKGDFIKSILPGRKVGHPWSRYELVLEDQRPLIVSFLCI